MITCYYCKGKHTTVAQVKDCANITAEMAKKVQIGTIVETIIPATVTKVSVPAHRQDAAYLALKAKVQLSQPIVEMVEIPGLGISIPAATTPSEIQAQVKEQILSTIKTGQDLELGMYQFITDNGQIHIYKIKWNKSNTYKYAEKLVITDGKWTKTGKPSGKFMYANSMMNKLTSEHKMTEAHAKAFHDSTVLKYGQPYGFCCVCGKLLTVKKSISKGIGPVCETKL